MTSEKGTVVPVTDISKEGEQTFRKLGKELKEFGDKTMRREFTRALTRTVQPLKADLPMSARRVLPRRGGLAEDVARAQIRVSRRANGVRVSARQKYQLGQMDDPGIVRHPAFQRKGEQGRRVVWVSQRIQPGWFTDPAERRRPQMQRDMLKAAHDAAETINRVRG